MDVAQKDDFFIQGTELGHWLGQSPCPGAAVQNSRSGCPKNPGGDPGSQGCSRKGGQGSEERFQAMTDSSEHEPSFGNSPVGTGNYL